MKKLILLAVVLIGITATSFAQLTASSSVFSKIQAPADPNRFLKIGWKADMDFGSINSGITQGVIDIYPDGSRGFTGASGVTSAGSGSPAIFLIEGCMDLKTRSSVESIITIPTVDFTLAPNVTLHVYNDLTNHTFNSVTLNPSTPGEYLLKIGGTLHIPANSTGSYTVGGLVVNVNMP